MENKKVYRYRGKLGNNCKDLNGSYCGILDSIKFKIDNSEFEFNSEIQLTKNDVLNRLKGSPDIVNVYGDFKSYNPKYYTPQIEEFRVGFEYEVLQKGVKPDPNCMYLQEPNPNDEWFKYKFPDPFLGYHLDKMFKTYNIRVKYLDSSDIESLRFKEIPITLPYFPEGMKEYLLNGCKIRFCEGKSNVGILVEDLERGIDKWNVVFYGTVKNISEFKVLVKQLGINA